MICDCWLGILNDYDQCETNDLHLSDVKEKLLDRSKLSKDLHFISNRFLVFEAADYIDRRRGLATLFNYCPLCGAKINWIKIRKGVKE